MEYQRSNILSMIDVLMAEYLLCNPGGAKEHILGEAIAEWQFLLEGALHD